jgi:hypothetical protein
MPLLWISSLAAIASTLDAQTLPFALHGNVREWVSTFVHSPAQMSLSETRVKLELTSVIGQSSAFRALSYYTYDGLTRTGALELQEAYLDYYSDIVDVRFGKQIITWGKADELNPTDVLSPQNMTYVLEEKALRKLGLVFLKTEWNIADFTFSAIWKPEFDYTRVPSLDSRWAFFTIPGLGSLPPPAYPGREVKNTEWAFKLSRTIERFDLSVSWFDGWDNIFTPVFTFNPATRQPQLDGLVFHRTRMLGADFASVDGPVGFWGEGAFFRTEDPDGNDPNVRNPYVQFVLGADVDCGDALKVNLQYFQEIITRIGSDAERNAEERVTSKLGLGLPIQQALTCRIEQKFGEGEAHKVEVMTIYDVKHPAIMIRPKLVYSPEDAVGVEVGGTIFGGKTESLFGRFRENHEVYVKGTYSF